MGNCWYSYWGIIAIDSKISIPNNIYRDSLYKGDLYVKDVLEGHPIYVMKYVGKPIFIKFFQTIATKR